MDEVKERIAELLVESSHHKSKLAKKQQRATFRDFMDTLWTMNRRRRLLIGVVAN